jgi:hypothetical protein
MLEILHRQQFRSGIPAGLPDDARVANKTGEMSTAAHDAGIVYLEDRAPYVVVVLTEWDPAERERPQKVIARDLPGGVRLRTAEGVSADASLPLRRRAERCRDRTGPAAARRDADGPRRAASESCRGVPPHRFLGAGAGHTADPHFMAWELIGVDVREAPLLRRVPAVRSMRSTAAGAALELFRMEVGTYVHVAANGGYRSPGHALNHHASRHCWGTAANIYRVGDTFCTSGTRLRSTRPSRGVCPGVVDPAVRHADGEVDDHLHLDLGYTTFDPLQSDEDTGRVAEVAHTCRSRRSSSGSPHRSGSASPHGNGGGVRPVRGRSAARPEVGVRHAPRFIRGDLMHRQGTSYHLPTGGAVYFDTGVVEVATPIMEIERGCAARVGRSLWESIRFVRGELDAWDRSTAGRAGSSVSAPTTTSRSSRRSRVPGTAAPWSAWPACSRTSCRSRSCCWRRTAVHGNRCTAAQDRIEVTADFTPSPPS